MKFIVTKNNLLEALTVTGKAVNSGNKIIPILENYKFDIDKDGLTVTGSSLDIFISAKCEIEHVNKPICFCLPSQRLYNLVKELPEQPLYFTVDEAEEGFKVEIKSAKGVYHMPAEDGVNFPAAKHQSEVEFKISRDILVNGLNKTLFACSDNELKPALTGAFIEVTKSAVNFTCTDAFIVSTFSNNTASDVEKQFIVPQKVLSVLQSLPLDDEINISLDNRSIQIKASDDVVMTGNLLDEKYPDIKSLIPIAHDKHMRVNRMELLSAVKRVSTFSNAKTHLMRLSASGDEIRICGEDIDLGEKASEEICCTYTGEDIEIGLSSKLMINSLNKLTGNEVHIHLQSPNRSAILRESFDGEQTKENLILIMPMMI